MSGNTTPIQVPDPLTKAQINYQERLIESFAECLTDMGRSTLATVGIDLGKDTFDFISLDNGNPTLHLFSASSQDVARIILDYSGGTLPLADEIADEDEIVLKGDQIVGEQCGRLNRVASREPKTAADIAAQAMMYSAINSGVSVTRREPDSPLTAGGYLEVAPAVGTGAIAYVAAGPVARITSNNGGFVNLGGRINAGVSYIWGARVFGEGGINFEFNGDTLSPYGGGGFSAGPFFGGLTAAVYVQKNPGLPPSPSVYAGLHFGR